MLKKPLKSHQNRLTVRLSQSDNDDSAMFRTNQRHRVIEIPIRSEDYRMQFLCTIKDRTIIRAKLTDVRKWNRFMSGCRNDIRRRLWKILVQQDFHAMAKLYGVSSNLASDPAKSNTAEMSSDVMLG